MTLPPAGPRKDPPRRGYAKMTKDGSKTITAGEYMRAVLEQVRESNRAKDLPFGMMALLTALVDELEALR